GIVSANTMRDGLVDLLDGSSPQPVVITQIGVPEAALRAAAVTRRAIVAEGCLAARKRKVQELGVVHDVMQIQGGDLLAERCPCGLRRRELFPHAVALAITKQPERVGRYERPGRVHYPITYGPDYRGVKYEQPPARQRFVQLLDAIPLVAGRGGARELVAMRISHGAPHLFPARDRVRRECAHLSRSVSCFPAKRHRRPRQRTAPRRR